MSRDNIKIINEYFNGFVDDLNTLYWNVENLDHNDLFSPYEEDLREFSHNLTKAFINQLEDNISVSIEDGVYITNQLTDYLKSKIDDSKHGGTLLTRLLGLSMIKHEIIPVFVYYEIASEKEFTPDDLRDFIFLSIKRAVN